jgi:predicted RNA binding protein with dsRBD fold (UPF0201 family)
MIIRFALLLIASAFILMAFADLLTELTLPTLPDFIIQLGLGLLLSAFALLLIMGLLLIGKQIIQAVNDYFSVTQRGQRQVLFIQNKQAALKQLFNHRAVRINYVHELKIQHLLRRNNRQQLAALSKAIDQDLQALKNTLPKATLKQLQQENRRYYQQQDSAALVQLQQKIRHDY